MEVHSDDWWRAKMESSGFIYSDWLTKEMRDQAKQDSNRLDLIEDMKTKNRTHYAVAQHLWTSLQVCILFVLFVCLLPIIYLCCI